jgi:protein-tyrosine phosphatase
VLFVCTGNICRSPLAERLGRAYLDEVLGERAAMVHVSSAGTRAVVGSAMHPDSALVLTGLGGDAEGFRSRQLEEGMPAGADVVLTMTRHHRREVLHVAPRALARSFTLREAADLMARVAPDTPVDGSDFTSRARNLVAAMAFMRAQRPSSDLDDIGDPIGRPVEVHEHVGTAISEALIPVFARIVSLDEHRAASLEGPHAG